MLLDGNQPRQGPTLQLLVGFPCAGDRALLLQMAVAEPNSSHWEDLIRIHQLHLTRPPERNRMHQISIAELTLSQLVRPPETKWTQCRWTRIPPWASRSTFSLFLDMWGTSAEDHTMEELE